MGAALWPRSALSAGEAAWFDRGRMLDKGMASNRRALGELANRQRAAREENHRRIASYRASLTVNPEVR